MFHGKFGMIPESHEWIFPVDYVIGFLRVSKEVQYDAIQNWVCISYEATAGTNCGIVDSEK